MPFWLRSNQNGEIPIQSNVFSLRAQLEKEYHQNDFKNIKLSRLTYGYKIRGVINAGNSNQFILSEIYFKTKFKSVEFYIGRKRGFLELPTQHLVQALLYGLVMLFQYLKFRYLFRITCQFLKIS